MATYAIGDIQGCYQSLQALLQKINFSVGRDEIWLAGDLINRGPDSLKTLEFIYRHQNSFRCVLGNHDLHFLAVEAGQHKSTRHDTFDELLISPNRKKLVQWLKEQPLFHYDSTLNFALVHAGQLPSWNLQQTTDYAKEVSDCLQSSKAIQFFKHMYGNLPSRWNPQLTGMERLRFITNALTRMRYCYSNGGLELDNKDSPENTSGKLLPWFEIKREALEYDLVFGHWASLQGQCSVNNFHALDTGCVWGGKLTALRLQDKRLFEVNACD